MNIKQIPLLKPLVLAAGLASANQACIADTTEEQPIPQYCFNEEATEEELIEDANEIAYITNQPCYKEEFRAKHLKDIQARVALHIRILYYDQISLEKIKEGVKRDIDAMNLIFKPTGLQFYAGGLETFKDDSLNSKITPDSSVRECDTAFRTFKDNGILSRDSILVNYQPKCYSNSGSQAPKRPEVNMYYLHPLVDTPEYPIKSLSGLVVHTDYLAHEMGHRFELLHPFQTSLAGDGIPGTTDYFRTCSYNPEDFPNNNYHVETYVQDGVCMVRCAGGCYEAPSNLMDYNICESGVHSTLIQEQIDIMKCTVNSDHETFGHGVNSSLPEIQL